MHYHNRQYDEVDLDEEDCITNFDATNAITSLIKIKEKITEKNKQQWHRKCWNNGTIKIYI